MPTLEIEVPQKTLEKLNMAPQELATMMKAMSALKMYELGQVSSQEAAELSGNSRVDFLQLLHTHQILPFLRQNENGGPIQPVSESTDGEILHLSNLHMPAWQTRRLHELLEQQAEDQLTDEERKELNELLRVNDNALLLKFEAIAEAVQRGLLSAATNRG